MPELPQIDLKLYENWIFFLAGVFGTAIFHYITIVKEIWYIKGRVQEVLDIRKEVRENRKRIARIENDIHYHSGH